MNIKDLTPEQLQEMIENLQMFFEDQCDNLKEVMHATGLGEFDSMCVLNSVQMLKSLR
jgi:hypothetical protein